MWGCCSRAETCTSRLKRSTLTPAASSGCNTLITTVRPSARSSATTMRDRFLRPYTEAAGAEYIAHVLAKDLPCYAIDVDGTAVGGIHLTVGTDIDRICAELGYWIGEEFWGRGIATAAIQLVTPHALS